MTTPNSNVLPQPIDVDATLSTSITGPVQIEAQYESGTIATSLQVTEKAALKVEVTGPLAGFGELYAVTPEPRFQLDAVYGVQTYDNELITSGTGATATAANGIYAISSGTSSTGYAILWSRRFVRHASGQSVRYRFTSIFELTGAPNSVQLSGALSKTDGLFFGYVNGTFGITRRTGGAQQIVRLTLTNGTTGAGNITVTLNSVAHTVAAAGALSTTAAAELIAESAVFTGWISSISPTANGATVTFIQDMPATAAGTYSVSGAGTVGTFATLQAGAPNDHTTNFVARSAWNVDRMDGSNGAFNPSGATLNLDKLNVYEIVFPYLGAGTIGFYIMAPNGRFILVHQIKFPGTEVLANQRNPSMRGGWYVANFGNTTNKTLSGASSSGFVEGVIRPIRNPFAYDRTVAVGTVEYVALAMRVRGEFSSIANMREFIPKVLSAGTETGSRITKIRCYINPTITGTVNWSYFDQTHSVIEIATPTTLAPSGGQLVATASAPSGAPAVLELQNLDVRLSPGDTFVISMETVSGSTNCSLSVNWEEK